MSLGDLLFPHVELKLVISHSFIADIEGTKNRFSDEYRDAAARITLSQGDMQRLGLKDGKPVQVKSKFGTVVVRAFVNERIADGIAEMPHSPWALALVGVPKDNSPPQLHGMTITLTKTEEEVTPLLELF